MATSVLAQLSAAKDRIAELTPVAGMDWRETMQRLLTRMGFPDRRDPCGITLSCGAGAGFMATVPHERCVMPCGLNLF